MLMSLIGIQLNLRNEKAPSAHAAEKVVVVVMPEWCRCTWNAVCFPSCPPIGHLLLQSISKPLCSDEKHAASVLSNLLLWLPTVTAQNRYSRTQRDPLKQAARGVCPRSGGHLCQGVLTLWPKGCCSTTMFALAALGHVPVWKGIHQAMPRVRWAHQPWAWEVDLPVLPILLVGTLPVKDTDAVPTVSVLQWALKFKFPSEILFGSAEHF